MSSRPNPFMNNIIKSFQSVIPNPHDEEKRKLKWESEAVSIIKIKIKNRIKLNLKNDIKLKIYQSKLRGKYSIISQLKSLLK